MDEKNLTPEESFDIINKAIANFKMNYKESSEVFILFGWILTLACFSHFIIFKIVQSKEAFELLGLFIMVNWLVFLFSGLIILFFIERKNNRAKKVYSYLDSYNKKLWWVTAVAFFVTIFLCMKLEIAPPPFMLLVAGIATTTSALLIKFKPLIIGGISFFIFSIATTFVTNEYLLLLNGAAIICGYLIPGYLLKSAKE
jgi:hypothetical protein